MAEREQRDFQKLVEMTEKLRVDSPFRSLLILDEPLPENGSEKQVQEALEQMVSEYLRALEPESQAELVQRELKEAYPRLKITARVQNMHTIIQSLYQFLPSQEEEQESSNGDKQALKDLWNRVAKDLDKFNEHVQARAKQGPSRAK